MNRFARPSLSPREYEAANAILQELVSQSSSIDAGHVKAVTNRHTKEKTVSTLSNAKLLSVYHELRAASKIPEVPWLLKKLRKRAVRTLSGIAPISVLTKPFACPGRCVYCPTERVPKSGKNLFQLDSEKKYGIQKIAKKYRRPGALVMPKSYISSEPAAMRALLNSFDPWKQVTNRLHSLKTTGHTPDKCELIVMGGTFSFLPRRYQSWFVRRCLQGLNGDATPRKSMRKVQEENEKALHRSVGIVLETRPDHMTPAEARRFRRLGCTRVEMGVQTLDDAVSAYTKRGHGREEVAVATKILRDAGFKICHHMMPGLPGSTPEGDLKSFHELYEHEDFKPDYVKIYPCVVTPFSELERWYRQKRFSPYSEEVLIPLLLEIKRMTPPWVRIARLIRDIPGTAIVAGSRTTNLRQHLAELAQKQGTPCQCIRCREIRSDAFDPDTVLLKRHEYWANGGREIFLSFETPENKLLSLLRLRIPSWFFPKAPGQPIFRTLRKCALLRELHTYGELTPLQKEQGATQHRGWGKKLVHAAENIVQREFGITHLAVISGIGVKEYYRRLGYEEDSSYLIKSLL